MPATGDHLAALSGDDRLELERRLVAFDRGWRPGGLAGLADTLPPAGSPLRAAALIEMVKIDLERRQQAGPPATAADYLAAFPELDAEAVRRAEDEVRRRGGSSATESVAPAAADATQAQPAPPSRRLPNPGDAVGRFRVERELGRGAMGAVYLAYDPQLDRKVALKVPTFDPAAGPELAERFLREGRAAAGVRHANVCPVYDVGEAGGVYYLAMAYIDGKPLSAFTAPGKLPTQPAAARVAWKIATALAEAHKHGVVHRDLKPSNVMVGPDKEPVVMDFGLARRVNRPDEKLTQDRAVLGTPAYMPPEQAAGDEAGPAADVYSLGVILYELLTGTRPFAGRSMPELFGNILTQEPDPPSARKPGVDPRLEAVVLRALRKRPEERFASMAEMAAALSEYLKAVRHQPASLPGGPPRRRLWARAAAVGLLLAAGAAAVVIYVRTPRGEVRVEVDDPKATVTVSVGPEDAGPPPKVEVRPPVIASTFDAGEEGWRVLPPKSRLIWRTPGGNPGGYLYSGELGPANLKHEAPRYWAAPARYLGDKRAYYGGRLTYDVRQEHDPADRPTLSPGVVLKGGGLLLWASPPHPGKAWLGCRVDLVRGGGWRRGKDGPPATADDLRHALGHLEELAIKAEYRRGPDGCGLDNVRLTPP